MSEIQKPLQAIQKATAHYKTQIGGELKSFYVKEWDLTIYHRSVQNLRSESEVVELSRQGKTVEALVVSIVNKARDEHGKLIFSKHDKDTFMNEVDPAVVLWVAGQLNSGTIPSVADLEKNSQEIQNSDG
jgi:hypothetical protein